MFLDPPDSFWKPFNYLKINQKAFAGLLEGAGWGCQVVKTQNFPPLGEKALKTMGAAPATRFVCSGADLGQTKGAQTGSFLMV